MAGLWLRLYTEIRHDRKLRRLPPARRWLWITLLGIAKESPWPGWLLLAEGVPVTVDDLADEAAIEREEVEAGLKDFTEQRMIEKVDGVFRLLNWDKRQFAGDSARERVQKHREKKKSVEVKPLPDSPADGSVALKAAKKPALPPAAAEGLTVPAGAMDTGYSAAGNDIVTLQDRYSNVTSNRSVTLQERYQAVACNVTVTPPETETDTETDIKELSSCSSSAHAHEAGLDGLISMEEGPELTSAFEREFGRLLSPMEIEQLSDWAKECTAPVILEALKRAALAGKYQFRYINGILANWLKNNLRTLQEISVHEAAFKLRDGPKGGKGNGYGLSAGKQKVKPGYRPGEVDWASEPDTL